MSTASTAVEVDGLIKFPKENCVYDLLIFAVHYEKVTSLLCGSHFSVLLCPWAGSSTVSDPTY